MGDVTYSIRISTMGPTMMTNLISTVILVAVILIVAIISGVVALHLHDKRRKERVEAKRQMPAQYIVFCPTCALPTKYIEKHKRYYCKAEKKYLPKGIPPPPGK
jgi:flagellar basal body-associated protein FliL